MDGTHDLGGKQGFGKVRYPAPEHKETWEPIVRAIWTLGLRNGVYNMDEYRHAVERMEPVHYISASYFERTLTAVATLLVEKKLVSAADLSSRVGGPFPLARPIGPGRQNAPEQRFSLGERVHVKDEHTSGHTRMPGYIRGKAGVVVGVSPSYPFPDAAAHAMTAEFERTYDVRFRAQDLWPDSCDDAFVHVGVFQSYLETTT